MRRTVASGITKFARDSRVLRDEPAARERRERRCAGGGAAAAREDEALDALRAEVVVERRRADFEELAQRDAAAFAVFAAARRAAAARLAPPERARADDRAEVRADVVLPLREMRVTRLAERRPCARARATVTRRLGSSGPFSRRAVAGWDEEFGPRSLGQGGAIHFAPRHRWGGMRISDPDRPHLVQRPRAARRVNLETRRAHARADRSVEPHELRVARRHGPVEVAERDREREDDVIALAGRALYRRVAALDRDARLGRQRSALSARREEGRHRLGMRRCVVRRQFDLLS
jgi:hypothetical protein